MKRLSCVAAALVGLLFLGGPAGAEDDAATLQRALAESQAKVRELEAKVKALEAALAAARDEVKALRGGGAGAPPGGAVPDVPALEDPTKGLQTSREQLRMLLFYYTSNGVGKTQGWPPLSGKNFVLWLVAKGYMARDVDSSLQALFSPGDRVHRYPGQAAYRDLTVEALQSGSFPKLTSYAGRRNADRDHVLTAQRLADGKAAILADLSYPGGALVGFSDGSVRWLSAKDLGLGAGDPIVAGDASKSPLLRSLSSD
jgi:hypothetical protein